MYLTQNSRHLAHRIREAMQDNTLLTGWVAADTTHTGGRRPRRDPPCAKKDKKEIVMGMVERGGKLRLVPVPDEKKTIMQPVLEKHISKDVDVIYTDEHPIHLFATKDNFDGKHKAINHTRSYAIGRLAAITKFR